MSVHVHVVIGGGAAERKLSISRLDNLDRNPGPGEPIDFESTYLVQSTSRARAIRATFKHVYSDDYGVLIAKATAALRDKHGQI